MVLVLGCTGERLEDTGNKGANIENENEETYSHETGTSEIQDPLKLLDAAIAAHGGDVFEKLHAGEMTVFMRGHINGDRYDEVTTVSTFQMPDRLHQSISHFLATKIDESQFVRDAQSTGQESTYIRNGMRAWNKFDEKEFQPDDDPIEIANIFPLTVVYNLIMIRQHSSALVRAGDEEIDGNPVFVIKVMQDGMETGSLAFDKRSKLLLRMSKNSFDPRTREPVITHDYYSGFRTYSGMTFPTKVANLLNDHFFFEETLLEFHVLDRVDEEQFVVPEQ